MNNTPKGEQYMTDKQSQMLLEAIKVIVEKSQDKEEALEAIERIQQKGIKKPE